MDWETGCAVCPEISVLSFFMVHVYLVPAGMMFPPPLAIEWISGELEHTALLCSVVTRGLGLTVTDTWKVWPTQLPFAPEVGVTV